MSLATPPAVTMADREIPLSLQPGLLQFKFHVLLECDQCQATTLGRNILTFIAKTQKIVHNSGGDFQHPFTNQIWDMVVKCTGLGDGSMITVRVPFNNATGKFDWETPNTMKNANLWVRVFEIGPARITEEEAIKANIDMAGKIYAYWERVHKVVLSEPTVLESCSESWKNALCIVDKELVEAKEKLAEVHRAWMEPTKIK